MDILFYSNYCKYSREILQFLSKNNLTNKINFICIDKRERNPQTGQVLIVLENGKKISMPPNIHSVPSLLLVNQKYSVLLGEDIITHFKPQVTSMNNKATNFNGEPMGYSIGASSGCNIVSEEYSFYNMSPHELSAKGTGGNRQMYNYVSADHNVPLINAQPDDYKPNKIRENDITISDLEQRRANDVPQQNTPDGFLYNPSL